MAEQQIIQDLYVDAEGREVPPEQAVRLDRTIMRPDGTVIRREWYTPGPPPRTD